MVAQMEELKVLSEELTLYASSVAGILSMDCLLQSFGQECWLLLAYESTYMILLAIQAPARLSDVWSANASKNKARMQWKFLYYDVDSSEELNQQKQAAIECGS